MTGNSQPPVGFARRLLLGAPLSSDHAEHTLLRKLVALPVFASDAISSVAYASQQIILALGGAGLWMAGQSATYGHYTLLITGLIVLLLGIVVMSYWQTVFAYPSGGGSYIVSKENLGTMPGLIAAAALLIDYVLTVSVSIAAGIQNLKDVPLFAHAHISEHLVLYCLLAIGVLTYANLRGLKESGTVFAPPTYAFVGLCYLMIFLGIAGPFLGWQFHPEYVNQEWGAGKAAETLGLVVLMKAFANGCSAMTGTEAVSNGIPAFQGNKSKNAALTLLAMGLILGSLFLGISFLAVKFHVVYWEENGKTANAVIDQLSGAIFGKTGKFAFLYVATQLATALILVLAANTAYADFPRLASILSKDKFLPRQLSNVGDRLVFNNGIVMLGVFAALLIVVKKGSVDALIPLYAIGVFLAFTLSQTGMVLHWKSEKSPGWGRKAAINGIGAVATFLVLLDIAFEKFTEGAWIVILLMAALVMLFRKIHRHYCDIASQLRLTKLSPIAAPTVNTVVLLVPSVHRGVLPALAYARSLSPEVRAVHVGLNPEKLDALRQEWAQVAGEIPLIVLPSPYRMLVPPLLEYLQTVQDERTDDMVMVILPEAVPTRWWHHLLHNQTGFRLKLALLSRPDLVVTNVRYPLQRGD
ncbi:APC family permease [Armatimonas rosea]|uniref:Amino acid transporter n=1 Tax=Armatimonas rosea TaxID=685828 RepID=A0A7W9W8F7_ARMRO|nr:APC family permease [Armatimonas rosea]MBB6052216.1 amino acid transporter [Armatimonas rosea]